MTDLENTPRIGKILKQKGEAMNIQERKKGNPLALIPIGVFLVLYLGMGLVFEYVLKIEMGFYKIPIVVVFLAALLVAFLQNR